MTLPSLSGRSQSGALTPPPAYWLALALITAVCAARFGAIWYGYPFAGYVDEPYLVDHAYAIARTGELHPGRFFYPSWTDYQLAALYGAFTPLVSASPTPDHFVLARGLAMAYATATVPLAAELARRTAECLPGPARADARGAPFARGARGARGAKGARGAEIAGITAALLLAASPLLSSFSFLATVNPPTAFWTALATLPALRILRGDRRVRVYLLAAVPAGLAIGTKYVAFPAVLPALAAHVLGAGQRRGSGLLALGLGVPITFLACTPYALLDYGFFLAELAEVGGIHREGGRWAFHESATGTSYGALGQAIAARGLGYAGLGLAGLGLASLGFTGAPLRRGGHGAVLLLALVPVTSYLWLGSFKVHFARNFIGALPHLAALAGLGVHALYLRAPLPPRLRAAAASLALVAALWTPLPASWRTIAEAHLPDTRTAALAWLDEHAPPGSRIVREYGTPPLEELAPYAEVFEVRYVRSILQPDIRAECAEWDFVLVHWAFRRVVNQVAAREAYADAYDDFFERHELAAEFHPGPDHRADSRYQGEPIGIVRILRDDR